MLSPSSARRASGASSANAASGAVALPRALKREPHARQRRADVRAVAELLDDADERQRRVRERLGRRLALARKRALKRAGVADVGPHGQEVDEVPDDPLELRARASRHRRADHHVVLSLMRARSISERREQDDVEGRALRARQRARAGRSCRRRWRTQDVPPRKLCRAGRGRSAWQLRGAAACPSARAPSTRAGARRRRLGEPADCHCVKAS